MRGLVFITLLSHWRRRPAQLVVLVIGLALATALWAGVQALNAEARAAYDRAAQTLGQDQLPRLRATYGAGVTVAAYADLRSQGYRVSPVIAGVWDIGPGAGAINLVGFDILTLPDAARHPVDMGADDFDLAAFLTPPGVVLMRDGPVGIPPPGPNAPRIQVVDTIAPGTAITDIATAARILGRSDISYLLVDPIQPTHLPPLDAMPGFALQDPQTGADIGRLADSFHLNLTAFGLLAFAVGLFIVHGTIGLAVEQRRVMIRNLRAMGAPLRLVLAAFGAELLTLALLGGAIGLGLGFLAAQALMPGVAGTLQDLYGTSLTQDVRFRGSWVVSGLAMALGGAVLAGAQNFVKIARMPVLGAARPQVWAGSGGRGAVMVWRGGTILGLILAGGALVTFGSGLWAGFGFLAALLLAAALLVPIVLIGVLWAMMRGARSVILGWLLADTRQNVPGLSLALTVLMLALATNIGVTTMVGSFRSVFIGWLDQRLAAEIYLNAQDAAQATAIAISIGPQVDAVLPNISTSTTIDGLPVEVLGLASHPTFHDHWPLLQARANPWPDFDAGQGVLISEQMARRQGLVLGDMVAIAPNARLPVIGVYSDYGNPRSQIAVPYSMFQTLYPDITLDALAIRVAPQDVADLIAQIRNEFDLPADAVIDQAGVKRLSLDVFERTFLVTSALNVLTLGVAGFAILTSFLTLANARIPQLAPIWALGVTRRHLAWFELARTLILVAITFCIALPVGLILAWGLLAVVNVEAFGWRIPLRYFPADYAVLGLWGMGAGVVSVAIPMYRLARISPNRLLKVFSNDR
jgi:putative ABC transport system permease protein